jgi:adenylyltransferase/sulfurtransferase
VPESLNSINAEELMTGMDVIIDGLDRPEPRYIVNRTCNELKIPYIFGAAIEAFGNVSTILPGQTFCLECFMSGLQDEDLPACGVVGVHPAVLGIVSSVQVSETVRVLTGRQPKLYNKLMYVDLREFEFNILDIPMLESCKVCGIKPDGAPQSVADRFFEETCSRDGRRNFVISPKKRLDIDMPQLATIIEKQGMGIKISGRLGITFEKSDIITACILKGGIMIAQTPPRLEDNFKTEVFEIYRSILVDGMGLPKDILPEV